MSVTDKDDPVFWKLQDVEPTYWDEYIATRPVYGAKIFQRIYDYHASHSPSRLAALDIGTGSGSAIGPLAQHFDHVVASDNDPTSLAFARGRYAAVPASHLSYTLSSGEDLLQHHSPTSFDLITCAETFPLMDTLPALHNASTLLRPGGTLAIWFYGPPFFTEEAFAGACQPVLDAIMDHNFRPVVNGGGDAQREAWRRAADGKASWLDYIPFDPATWTDVQRHKWNTQARLSFFTPAACGFPVKPVSRVEAHELVSEERDADFWKVEWDGRMLRRFVRASFPKTREVLEGKDEIMDALFKRLMNAMGGQDARRKLSWPAVLVLASRKGDS
ncbi:S-adenosyl-L-methionine-dependent methyltransferase [Hypoxylon fragiforme]|uniref:S-adenosyl-L-methionine-dependent methyltransferase n=1 Tax=Hypoxylon fragiforme TaxID=63214 RepID=UPI0020C72637|nr:S-adenosyl-L-methionine-dependent methyltransferase [Hypoxylon fragiforme]KAI2609644.1 S-adenosyl-L-methionine-dependent methyltransferase [Hypoxylon fragiforme]